MSADWMRELPEGDGLTDEDIRRAQMIFEAAANRDDQESAKVLAKINAPPSLTIGLGGVE